MQCYEWPILWLAFYKLAFWIVEGCPVVDLNNSVFHNMTPFKAQVNNTKDI